MKKILFPLGILFGGVLLAFGIIVSGPKLEPQPPPSNAPLVRVWAAQPSTVQMTTVTHGTVMPRTQSELIPEVSGRVIAVSPAMVSGGFFEQGQTLFEIDQLDYEVALEQARAALASAGSELINAQKAHERQLDLAKRQSASQSQQDDAQNRLNFALASQREARARLSRAERDMARTKITAPYDGRVRSEQVDIGQFVNRGTPVASIYAIDAAEVRLPIHDEELAYLDLPLAGEVDESPATAVLRARFAGADHTWEGKIVRTEGELDPQTRMINVVAKVESPYKQINKPPLAVGLFVEAEIMGRQIDNVFVVPRSALQANNQIYVLNAENRIEFRDVEILRIIDEEVYLTAGLSRGEIVCISTLSNAVEGILVIPNNETEGLAKS